MKNVEKMFLKILKKLEKNLEKIMTYQFNFKKLHIKRKKVAKN